MAVVPALADDNGLAAAIHDIKREGSKLCQDGHFHTGTSAAEGSKKSAMAQAIASWQSFTALEYGTDWAYYRFAGSKSANCTSGSSGWSCEVQGRPCKVLSRRKK
ncbi:MAG: hypothetical protein H6876_02485 [Hyphomicrobiaceae bacterium]|nr:hypothetical protein [Hyphomicrobiaceae bacterium]MCC0006973.1 hypothetical protein [Hyphomicrobiaceae bacterium]